MNRKDVEQASNLVHVLKEKESIGLEDSRKRHTYEPTWESLARN